MPTEYLSETAIKRPQSGSIEERVFNHLYEKAIRPSSAEIVKAEPDLTLEQVRGGRARLHRYRFLPRPTHREWQEELSNTRGTIWPKIRKYAQMGMTPGEILLVRAINNEPEFPYEKSYDKVENALNKAWRSGRLERRAKEEKRINRLAALHTTPKKIPEKLAGYLRLIKLTEALGIPEQDQPKTPTQWSQPNLDERFASMYLHRNHMLMKDWLPANLVPGLNYEVNYLVHLEVLRTSLAQGDRTFRDFFPDVYENIDPEIAEKLGLQTGIIRKRVPVKIVATDTSNATVIYADVGSD